MRHLALVALLCSACAFQAGPVQLAVGDASVSRCRGSAPERVCEVVKGGRVSAQAAGIFESVGALLRFLLPGL